MKKRSWQKSCAMRCRTRNLIKDKRILKRLRHKRARKSSNPKLIYKTTGSWEIV